MVLNDAHELMEQVSKAWEPFAVAVRRLGPDGIARETPAGWAAKEMLGHVAFWDEAVVGAVTSMIRQQPMPPGWGFGSGYLPAQGEWPRADVHNAREAARARSQPASAVLERLWNSHAALVDFLPSVTPQELLDRADYFDELGKHYLEHQRELDVLTGSEPGE